MFADHCGVNIPTMNVLVGLWWPQSLQQMRSPLSSHAQRDKHPSQDRNPITEARVGWGEACRRRPQVLGPRLPSFLALDLRLTASFSFVKWGNLPPVLPSSEVLVRMKSRKGCVSRSVPHCWELQKMRGQAAGASFLSFCHLQTE